MLATIDKIDATISQAIFNTISAIVPRYVFMLLEEGGDGVFWLVSTIVLCLYPGLPTYERTVATNLFAGLWVDLAFIGTTKALFRRPRPSYNAPDMHIIASVDRFGFPSGHASRVGFVTTFIWCCYHASNPTICAIVLAWGVLTASSRAFMGRHYIGDVVAGLLLGLCTTAVVTKGTWVLQGSLISQSAAIALYATVLTKLQVLSTWLRIDKGLAALHKGLEASLGGLQGAGGGAAGAAGAGGGVVS